MQYSIENDGIYKVEIVNDKVALKTLLVPKDIVLKAAEKYTACETQTLMRE